LPLLFLLFVAIATGGLSAYAGRDEIRHSGEAMWRTEAFLAYALFVGLVLLPTVIYFYVFHGDWFLFYWIDTGRAPWVWGFVAVLLLLCDDLEPLVQDVRSRIAPEREAEGETFDSHPTFVDAMKFWASPAAMHLREHMGLLTA